MFRKKRLPLCKQLFGKKIKDMTKEEYKEYNRICAKNTYKYVKKGYKTDWSIKNLGKRFKDLNEEEKREFWKMQKRLSRQRKNIKGEI